MTASQSASLTALAVLQRAVKVGGLAISQANNSHEAVALSQVTAHDLGSNLVALVNIC